MENMINMQNVINSLVFSLVGIVMLIIAFVVIDLLTPRYHIWSEIVQKQNVALGILCGAFLIGVSMIIAAAVHG